MPASSDWSELEQRCICQAAWSTQLRTFLLRRLPKDRPSRILEIGCGSGAILRSLSEETGPHTKLIGIDLDFSVLPFTRGRIQTPLLCADGACLPLLSASFDMVLCHYLLLWAAKPVRILREMRRVCRAGGVCAACAEPDYDAASACPSELRALAESQRLALIRRGINPRAGRELSAWFAAAGFQNIQSAQLRPLGKNLNLQAEISCMQQDSGLPQHPIFLPSDAFYTVPTFYAFAEVQ